jgi:hypothetical protein
MQSCAAYIDVRPICFVIGLPIALLVGALIGQFALRQKTGAVIVLSGLIYTAIFWFALCGPFVDVERQLTFPMTWKIEPPGLEGRKESTVILTFRDFPNHFVGVASDEVASYLRHRDLSVVDVTFAVTTDWGHTRGFHEVRIGELARWSSVGGFAGTSSIGNNAPSPWP